MVWGVNFGRNIARKNETTQWIQVPRSESWPGTYHPTYQGKLIGLHGIASPSYFDMKPYLLGGLARNLDDTKWQRTAERDLGLDMKYGVTSNLTLDLTVNTDFAQVEADQEEVNLTRFSLFFPERREFFLEGQRTLRLWCRHRGFRSPTPVGLLQSAHRYRRRKTGSTARRR